MTYKLICEYDGTFYHGWQKQPLVPTIQGTLEKAITSITGETPSLIGAGRTDAGVHARAQTAHFRLTHDRDPQKLQRGLNAVLPQDIAIRTITPVADLFHARYHAIRKTYRYTIYNGPIRSPQVRSCAWFLPRPLNLPKMRAASRHFLGKHDFTSLTAAEHDTPTCVLTLESLEIRKQGEMISVTLTASRFLRYMVRNIVGLLVEVGYGRRCVSDIPLILKAHDRRKAGPTAPPHGLGLMEIEYPPSERSSL